MNTVRTVGRYELHDAIASGGMAEVCFGRLAGDAGFRRIVAIKRLHPSVARDPAFRAMLLDEARLVGNIRHANVAAIVDMIDENDELSLVLDYVAGESLSRLARESRRRAEPIPPGVAVGVVVGMLRGLHAAHEATDASGVALGLVHRDVSPQNVVVGSDGVPRVIDFGIAKALGRAQRTEHGEVKGKAGYMAPEQIHGGDIDRRADVFAAGIVLWELLAGTRLFEADSAAATMMRVLEHAPSPPSEHAPAVSPELDAIAMRALSRDRTGRFPGAAAMADALEALPGVAASAQVARWVHGLAGPSLDERADRVRAIQLLPPRVVEAITEVTPSPRRARHRALLGVPLVLVVLVALGALGAAFALRTKPAPAVVAPPPVLVASVPEPAAVSPVVPVLPPVATLTASAAPATFRPRVPKPKASASPSCTPPYTVGPTGIHVLKPECL